MKTADMIAKMHEPVPASFTKTKTGQGTEAITYIPWYYAVALADTRTGCQWSHEVVEHWLDDAQRGKGGNMKATELAHVRVRVTLHGDDRDISREAVGVDDDPSGQYGTPLERAEAAGIRRALAKFGLGLQLYDKDRKVASMAPTARTTNQGAPQAKSATKLAPPTEEWEDDADAVLIADFGAAIAGAATLDELKKIGDSIKGCAAPVGAALRTAYLTRQGQIIDGASKTVKRGSPALVN